jgi:hypothetical protein
MTTIPLTDVLRAIEEHATKRKGQDADEDTRRLQAAAALVRMVATDGPPLGLDEEIERETREAVHRYTQVGFEAGWRAAVRPLVEVRAVVQRTADIIDARYQDLRGEAARATATAGGTPEEQETALRLLASALEDL